MIRGLYFGMKNVLNAFLLLLDSVKSAAIAPAAILTPLGLTLGLERLGLSLTVASFVVVFVVGSLFGVLTEATRYRYKLDVDGNSLARLSDEEQNLRAPRRTECGRTRWPLGCFCIFLLASRSPLAPTP